MVNKWGEIPPMTVDQIWRKLGLTDASPVVREDALRQYISEQKIVKPPLRQSLRRAGYEHFIALAGTALTAPETDTEPSEPV